MKFLSNLYHRIMGNHTVEAIMADFHAARDRLNGLGARKLSESIAHNDAADLSRAKAIEAQQAARAANTAAAKLTSILAS